jgi:hypothetical protein
MKGLSLTALFGGVAYLLNWVFVPKGLEAFNLIAAIGAMAGYALGDLASQKITSAGTRALLVGCTSLAGVGCTLAYMLWVQEGAANQSDIISWGILVALIFFCFSSLMPVAGVLLETKPGPPK